ncbi:MAG: peptidoglycan editing factor PgeF [Bacteroidota bacterium]
MTPSLYQFPLLTPFPSLIHFVSGRHGGVSEGELGTLNLGFRVADNPQHVTENRRRLAASLGIAADQLVFPAQTHSARVQVVKADTSIEDLADTDALITQITGRCICVMSADCTPILLYDPVKQAVGAVHAGWRGTVSKILTHTVQAMQEHFGTQPAHLLVGIGPSISPEMYEVGQEVLEAVKQAYGSTQGLITRENGVGKGFFNLWEANRQQLLELGVPVASIEVSGICTYQQSDRFFSARKSANRAGRFAAGIMLQ